MPDIRTIRQKQKELIHKLIAKSGLDEIEWEKTAFPSTFRASFPTYSVSIALDEILATGSSEYVCYIHDASGKLIDRFSHADLAALNRLGETSFELMQDLYELARRRALGTDQALDDLLGQIG